MSFLSRISGVVSRGLVNAGRTRARQDLLQRSDRFLADNGFSREFLEQGNSAWPWRADGKSRASVSQSALLPAGLRSPVPAELKSVKNTYRAAEAELKSFSDAELSDLGIARSSIADAVRNGRPGIDLRSNEESHDRKAA